MQKVQRVNDVANYLAVSKSQVWKLTRDGVLKSYKMSDRVTVWKTSELDKYIAEKLGA